MVHVDDVATTELYYDRASLLPDAPLLPVINRNILYLAVCQGLMLSSVSLIMSSSALVGAALAPDLRQATLPLGLTFLALMATMIPASMFMRRYGRRRGFVLGAVAGLLGGLVAATSIHYDNFVGFCVGSALCGVANGFAQYYRFAAIEVADSEYRARAISWVLAGGLVAAFIGPNVAHLGRDLIPDSVFAGSYGSIAIFCLGVIAVQYWLRIPLPSQEERAGPKRPLIVILTGPVFLVSVVAGMVAYGTMNLLMVATPLAMGMRNMPFVETAQVIQWHIVGMYAPSFFTGDLIQRFGVLRVMFTGIILLVVCVLVALNGEAYFHFLAGLILLGLGWNFLFVGSTTLLTQAYWPAEKGMAQGVNNFCVFSATALTALTAGYLHHLLGWERLNLYTVPLLVVIGLLIALLGASRRHVERVA